MTGRGHFRVVLGYQIPLESRHTKLYDEFLQRTPGLAPSTPDEPASSN